MWLSFIELYHTCSSAHPVSTNVFLAEFSEYLESIILSTEKLLIAAVFNIHIDLLHDPDGGKLRDLFESVGLTQHVNSSTHVQGHTLDLIVTLILTRRYTRFAKC